MKPAQIVKPQNRGGRNLPAMDSCKQMPSETRNRASDGICVFADGGF
ncbi:hypothetical protein NEILACOT_04201 [Neisseria lactamica ATCC 23970]|uniref:Uncharacterized protein n=1 Tax=Neisseria lactamica ATCC 23970 TaxID=546265 RepID=D0W9I9_NEILA|nr:hypothetical protein NEILACOT_04201 [Neisseria lactamica ATCC 23970]